MESRAGARDRLTAAGRNLIRIFLFSILWALEPFFRVRPTLFERRQKWLDAMDLTALAVQTDAIVCHAAPSALILYGGDWGRPTNHSPAGGNQWWTGNERHAARAGAHRLAEVDASV